MQDIVTYTDLSIDGLFDTYCQHYNITPNNDLLVLPKEYGNTAIQKLKLPGDISILFGEFHYLNDYMIRHISEKQQKYSLWISILEVDGQQFSINNETLSQQSPNKAYAFLLNSIFNYEHIRKKGAKGKTIMFFFPDYIIECLGIGNSKEVLLGNFYALKCKGISLIKLSDDEILKMNKIFYQWQAHKNVLGISKYCLQLLEWYFGNLKTYLLSINKIYSLTQNEAVDLDALQNFLLTSIHSPKPALKEFEKKSSTSLLKLKKLFETMYAKTLYEYFNTEKLNAAMQILVSTDKNIAEIAYEYGYANPSNFSDAFKRQYSLSPNEYRHLHYFVDK